MKGYPSEEGRGRGWEEKTVNERKGMSGVCCNVRGWEADMGQVLLSDLAIDRGSCNTVCSVRMRLPKCANPASRVARRHSNAIVEARHTIQSSVSAHWMSMRWSVPWYVLDGGAGRCQEHRAEHVWRPEESA